VELHRQGLIYRDKRLINWDPKLQTAISDVEVESIPIQGAMYYFNYPLEGSEKISMLQLPPAALKPSLAMWPLLFIRKMKDISI
jgi:valyl-tRNA synthetase